MDAAVEILKRYWGYPSFRPRQREIIEEVVQGRDLLAMLPTGGGKSLTFQVPALLRGGVCVVITPLIALMKDQVANLRKRGIEAAAIYSGMEHEEIMSQINKAGAGKLRLLYVSPERLSSDWFIGSLSVLPVSLIAVDEAHCISQWGYDFRPSYLKISEFRDRLPGVPLLALTATATVEVAEDIQKRLGFTSRNVIKGDFMRPNLSYVVRKVNDKEGELVKIIKGVKGCAIVYVRRRAATLDVSDLLNGKGIRALPYHAGMSFQERNANQEAWMAGQVTAIVATNAFGMGIDKPDVRAVVHYDVPDSPEAYFQEAGRAGRDGVRSYAVLLTNDFAVRSMKRRVAKQFPPMEKIREVYGSLCDSFNLLEGDGKDGVFPFDREAFSRIYGFAPDVVSSVLMLLQGSGYLEIANDLRSRGRVMFRLERRELDRVELVPEEERVVEYFLRNMSGVFSTSVYFDEQETAEENGMDRNALYHLLQGLSGRGILAYVPGDNASCIIMKQPRMPESYVELPPDIYSRRMEAFKARIQAMMDYMSLENKCRQRFLMEYFGMDAGEDCAVCDICLGRKKKAVQCKGIEEELIRLLKSGDTMDVHELIDAFDDVLNGVHNSIQARFQFPKKEVVNALRRLLDKGLIVYDSMSGIRLKK